MSDITTACRDIGQLTPSAQTACHLFMQKCKAAGYDVFITETYRSQARQDYLYSLGRTRPGSKVTWTHNSRHTSRRAWDIATRGGGLYNKAVLQGCGKIAASLGITWGGTWSTPDTPHFEISTNWKEPKEEIDMDELRALQDKVKCIDDSLTNLYKINERQNEIIAQQKATISVLEEKLTQSAERIYNTIAEVPEWYRPTVQKLVNKNILRGDENGRLNLTEETVRVLVVNDRAGLYD